MGMPAIALERNTSGGAGEETASTVTLSKLKLRMILAGRFQLLRLLGGGAMGDVYECEDLLLRQRVALKILRRDIGPRSDVENRFKQEVVNGRRVTAPNVCRIFDLGLERSQDGSEILFFTMELLQGETLAARIRRGALAEAEALPLILDIAAGLEAIHRAKIVHRDVKSSNIILAGSERVRAVLTDFGLSSVLDGKPAGDPTAGTIHYMAPEQIRGEEITPATDLYAFGVVMYEMLTGQRPFTASNPSEVLLKHLTGEPRRPSAIAPWLQPHWDRVLLTCLRKRPEARFASADQLCRQISGISSSQYRNIS